MAYYKMRAECLPDVVAFLQTVKVADYAINNDDNRFGDVTCCFTSSLPLPAVRRAMAAIVDGHVMLETVANFQDYTGERKWVDCVTCEAKNDCICPRNIV